MKTTENKVLNRIYANKRGYAFSKKDFADLGHHKTIDKALSRLSYKGRIRRIVKGIYDYPKYSDLLKQDLSPDIDQVARALARKFGWNIQISGNAALNLLGLSTQVPTKYLYYTDGRDRTYYIGNVELTFKKVLISDIGLKYPDSEIVVQAIKALGEVLLTEDQKKQVKEYFSPEKHTRILKDTKYTTRWVYDIIKSIFKEEK